MRRHIGACALLFVMGLALMLSMRNESPTTDEPLHLTRGLAFFWGPDVSLSYAHPPLGDALAALPVALSQTPVRIEKLAGFKRGDVSEVARALITPDYEHRRRWFWQARTSVAVLTLAFGAYLYAFCLRTWGLPTALAALFFFALNPTLVAHGRLVTTDLPVTAAMFVATAELVSYLLGGARWHMWTAACMTGVALATKFTAVALVPICAVLLGAAALFQVGRYAGRSRGAALRDAVAVFAVIGVVSLGVVNAAYRFEHTGLSVAELLRLREPVNPITGPYKGKLLEQDSLIGRLPKWLPMPLPHTYVVGLASVRAHDRNGHSSVFFGRYSKAGSRAYFPVMLAIKLPALLLLALVAGLLLLVRERVWPSPASLAFVAFVAVLLLIASRASINIGVRHVLPVFPPLVVLGGRAVVRIWERWPGIRFGKPALGALALAHASGMLWCFPDYLSDFNLFVGGKSGGERVSVIGEEWGQDMIRLGAAARARGVKRLYFDMDTFTAGLELARFQIEQRDCPTKMPRDAYVAINARAYARGRGNCYRWIRRQSPWLDIANHVLVFRTPAKAKDKPYKRVSTARD